MEPGFLCTRSDSSSYILVYIPLIEILPKWWRRPRRARHFRHHRRWHRPPPRLSSHSIVPWDIRGGKYDVWRGGIRFIGPPTHYLGKPLVNHPCDVSPNITHPESDLIALWAPPNPVYHSPISSYHPLRRRNSHPRRWRTIYGCHSVDVLVLRRLSGWRSQPLIDGLVTPPPCQADQYSLRTIYMNDLWSVWGVNGGDIICNNWQKSRYFQMNNVLRGV